MLETSDRLTNRVYGSVEPREKSRFRAIRGQGADPRGLFRRETTYNMRGSNEELGEFTRAGRLPKRAITQRVKTSQKALKASLEEMHTIDSTALGTGLVAATGLAAKGKLGSRVIICTDGLANVGMGSVSASVESLAFYDQVGNYAQERGIAIHVVSLVASECWFDILSPIPNLTGGNIRVRVQRLHSSTC